MGINFFAASTLLFLVSLGPIMFPKVKCPQIFQMIILCHELEALHYPLGSPLFSLWVSFLKCGV